MTQQPDVTVILPVHNRASTIVRAASSALAQVDVSIRLLVLDDASTDQTVDTVHGMRDKRISVVTAARRAGAGATRNVGLDLVETRFAAFIDSDDEWLPTKLSSQLAMLSRTSKPTLGSSGFMVSDRLRVFLGGPLARHDQRPSHVLGTTGGEFVTSGFVVNGPWLDSGLRFDPALAALEDQDLAISTMLAGGKVHVICEPLFVKYREAGPRESVCTNLAGGHLQLILKHHRHQLWRRRYTVQHLAEFGLLSHHADGQADGVELLDLYAQLAAEDDLTYRLATILAKRGRITSRAVQLTSRLADPYAMARVARRRAVSGALR